MKIKEWKIAGSPAHTVRIEHWWLFSGKARILIDGEEIFCRPFCLWDTGFEHRFELGGKPTIVRCLFRTWHYEYELWIDGKLQ
ncbi:MAG: hypothetical protein RRC34_15925 [Lentisphaeria bacterium]|nr:hypothetical protein [Lentisphaeria bacterium]